MADTFSLTRLSEAIEDSAVGPKSVSVDSSSATARDLREQIEFYRFASSVNAADKNHRGLYFTKIVPPATV